MALGKMATTALPREVERRFLAVQWAIATFAFVGILTFPFPQTVGGRAVVAVAVAAYALMLLVRAAARRQAAKSKPANWQTVLVPWEWVGDPGEEWSVPIFGDMEIPRSLGVLGSRRRTLGLPAPGGDVSNYSFFVSRPGVGRLTYLLQDGEVTQLVHFVRGFNLIQLQREDEPTGSKRIGQ